MRSIKPILAAKTCSIIVSALFCLLGLLLLIYPGVSVSIVGIAAAIMLIGFGVTKLTGFFSRDLYRLAFQYDLASGILLVALGALLLIGLLLRIPLVKFNHWYVSKLESTKVIAA